MTVKKYLLNELLERGLWPNDAATVLELALPQLSSGSQIRWSDDVSAYPTAMYAVLIISLKRIALAWIDENQPHNWCRAMFTANPEAEIERLKKELNV